MTTPAGADGLCCDLHGRNCEPLSELCCDRCPEADHPSHRKLGPCSNPDLSSNVPAGAGDTTPAEAITLIAAERSRQISAEGYTPDHDAEHDAGELASAAAVYALSSFWTPKDGKPRTGVASYWPSRWTFKPASRVRMLVKAGALIAAEIDRLLAQGETDD